MNKVLVTVIGVQKDEAGEENRIELISVGKHYCKNGVHYILYEDSEISGMEGTTTLLKVADDSVSLIRKGKIMQEQYFALDKKSLSTYTTPYGRLKLSVLTKKLDIQYGVISGNIEIDYELSIDGKWQSDNQLQIKVCADGVTCSNIN
ncbi:DUF1934 domain-containing protein [Anaerosinus massiliensis]|uniref:DUF1934 domain-containing protein n=1 Tax=Massilibacillus massiliensis TaxID=1806837 RepID=UPI000DA639DD|nr:DUF1934 domain-containing protein [Massilibacillus massiliensis]